MPELVLQPAPVSTNRRRCRPMKSSSGRFAMAQDVVWFGCLCQTNQHKAITWRCCAAARVCRRNCDYRPCRGRPMMGDAHARWNPGHHMTPVAIQQTVRHYHQPWYRILYAQVLIAIALGILVGYFYPDLGKELKPLGDGFIALIKMMIAPVIFCTVVHGISSMGDLKRVGRVGLKALIYFETVSTVALAVGLLVGRVLQPGHGFNIDPSTIDPRSVATYVTKAKEEGIVAHLMGIIPDSYFDALARGFITLAATLSIVLTFRSSRSRYWSASTSS